MRFFLFPLRKSSYTFSMKKIILLLALSFSPFAYGDDDYISAKCQAKLLKITTDEFVKEFPQEGKLFDYIGQVTFNYGIKGYPRTVFFGTHKLESNRRCLVQVYTKVSGVIEADGCPDYTFAYIDSNCK